jgi:putative PIN family toxin of toxin-antitoxin system
MMFGAVIDTNVLVSGLLTSKGNCAAIIEDIQVGNIIVYFNDAIIDEYRAVLMRPEFGFSNTQVDDLIAVIMSTGVEVVAPLTSKVLPDEADRKFYDVALFSEQPLISGNARHFPGMKDLLSPAQYIGSRGTP